MRLELRNYDLRGVSRSGNTTAANQSDNLYGIASDLTKMQISAGDTTAEIVGLHKSILRYMVVDFYSHVRFLVPHLANAPKSRSSLWASVVASNSETLHNCEKIRELYLTARSNIMTPDNNIQGRPSATISYASTDVGIVKSFRRPKQILKQKVDSIISIMIEHGTGAPSAEKLAKTIGAIDHLVEIKSFASLDALFRKVVLSQISAAHMIALLRNTAFHENELMYWATFRNKVKEALMLRGVNTEKTMRGLM